MKRNRGYGLIELLLVLGAVAVGVSVILGLYRTVQAAHAKDEALDAARAVLGRMDSAFAAMPNYQALSQQRAIDEGLFGPEARVEEGRVLLPRLGEVMVVPVDATVRGQQVQAAAYQLIFPAMPAALCPLVAGQLAARASGLEVGGQALTPDQAQDPGQVAGPCAQGGDRVRVVLTFLNPAASQALEVCQVPAGPQEQVVGCPAGQTGHRVQQRTGLCAQPYGDVQWSAWTTVFDGCSACPDPETQIQPCLPGQYGQRSVQRSFDCQAGEWGDWVVLAQSCTDCPSDPEQRQGSCMEGQVGYTVEERQFQCTQGTWGPWVVRERFCAPASGMP